MKHLWILTTALTVGCTTIPEECGQDGVAISYAADLVNHPIFTELFDESTREAAATATMVPGQEEWTGYFYDVCPTKVFIRPDLIGHKWPECITVNHELTHLMLSVSGVVPDGDGKHKHPIWAKIMLVGNEVCAE